MKKKLSILIALVIAISLLLSSMPVSANFYDSQLILNNKDSSWNEIEGDGIRGRLEFNSRGREFEYRFFAKGLKTNTDYSLIYYADPWPGDNPGALVAEFTTNNKGKIKSTAGSVDLGMSLPHKSDANYPGGAKIWLVPSSDYNAVTNAMTAWNPVDYLFERNLITYIEVEGGRDRSRLTVLMSFGRDSARYDDDNALKSSIEAIGLYDDTGYMLVIPEGTIIERTSGRRLNCLYLKDIDDNVLTFTTGKGDVEFSEPCVLYTTDGEMTRSKWGRLVTDGEWVEVGSFTSIIAGEAVLE